MKLRLVHLLLLASISGATQAAFYVDEDAPVQTAAQAVPMSKPQIFNIPFFLKRAILGPAGRKAIQEMLTDIQQADVVVITGYGDTLNGNALGRQRAVSIRSQLIQAGIPLSKIEVLDDNSVRPSETLNIFNSTVTITKKKVTPFITPDRQLSATLVLKNEEKKPKPTVAAPQPVINDPVKLAIATKLVALGQNKIIKPEDAVALIAEFLKTQETQTPAPEQQLQGSASTTAVSITPPAPAPTLQFVPVAEIPRSWQLSSSKSLKENIEDWSKQAGWEKPIWDSANPYQVTFSSAMNGTFIEVLGQISKAVPELDFQVWKNRKVFRVADRKQ